MKQLHNSLNNQSPFPPTQINYGYFRGDSCVKKTVSTMFVSKEVDAAITLYSSSASLSMNGDKAIWHEIILQLKKLYGLGERRALLERRAILENLSIVNAVSINEPYIGHHLKK